MGERLGGADGGGGAGGGAGGLCATVTGPRTAVAIARKTKVRMPWLIDRFLGRGPNPRPPISLSQGSSIE
jgi:hypothetical protein